MKYLDAEPIKLEKVGKMEKDFIVEDCKLNQVIALRKFSTIFTMTL